MQMSRITPHQPGVTGTVPGTTPILYSCRQDLDKANTNEDFCAEEHTPKGHSYQHWFRRGCNRGHVVDSGDHEVCSGSNGEREVTVESSSIILGVNGDRIGIEFLLGRFDREISWLLSESAKGGQ